MQGKLVVDSSTLIALERVNLHKNLENLDFQVLITPTVGEEINYNKNWKGKVKVKTLRGKSLKKVEQLVKNTKIGRGEAECLVLAKAKNLNFIISDDRKLIRQKFFSKEKYLKKTKIVGFSFFLFLFERNNFFNKRKIWESFDKIIKTSNWKRSEVYVANYTFLKEMGY